MSNKIIKKYKKQFFESLSGYYATGELESIYRLVIENVFHVDYILFSIDTDIKVDAHNEKKLSEILERLLKYEPVQHILGKAHFYDLDFEVNPNVLIPRQETELLVHMLIDKFRHFENPLILDIGTGSGCIAISLKNNLPGASVWALDISEKALETAQRNASLINTEITFLQDDILNPLLNYNSTFDLIVSNPPYVRHSEKDNMHKNVVDFDPQLALYVEDDDPLIYYRGITEFAKNHLKSGGVIAFEINEAYGNETEKVLLDKGFQSTKIVNDLNGKDRFVTGNKI